MTDPPRLVQSCSDEFARELLSSSRDDAGSSRAYQRTLSSLGVGAVVELAAESAANAAVTALAPAPKLGFVGFAKLLSAGAAVGIATVAGLHLTTTPSPAPRPAPSVVARDGSPVRARPAPAAARSPAPVVSAERERAPARNLRSTVAPPAVSVDSSPGAPEPASSVALDARPPSVVASALEREVQLLDAVKQALRQGDGREALSALGAYEREFARGALAPEARVLRVRALLAAGDREAAEQAARRVLESDPHGRHAAVVRALIARDANP